MYKWYGDRGITMCDEWRNNFISFLNDVGIKNDKTLTLDRIDNSRGYEPGNCRWVTMKVQCNNRRKKITSLLPPKKQNKTEMYGCRKKITVEGQTKTVKEWSNLFGYKNNSLYVYKRLRGITYEKAIKFILECR